MIERVISFFFWILASAINSDNITKKKLKSNLSKFIRDSIRDQCKKKKKKKYIQVSNWWWFDTFLYPYSLFFFSVDDCIWQFRFFFNFFRFFLNIHTLITGVCCLWASTGLPFFPTFIIFIMIIFGGNLFGQKKIYLSCLAHTHWMMGPIYTFTHTVSYLNKIFNLKFNKKN